MWARKSLPSSFGRSARKRLAATGSAASRRATLLLGAGGELIFELLGASYLSLVI
jgi:hypothetical protein